MSTIPRRLLDDLSDDLDALSGAGRQMVLNFLANAEWSDVSELRVLATEAMEGICSSLGDVSTARTAQFYDDVRAASVGAALGKVPDTVRSPDATAGAVRALIQTVADTGETDVFGGKLAERVDYEVKRASGECVKSLAKADPLKPRYARVPAGGDTCRFCLMLASRGFVYHNKKTAGENGHYHANCHCRIVPGFGDAPSVAGYDPQAYYDQCRKMLEGHEKESHYDLLTRNGRTTKRMYKTAEYDYGAALGVGKKSGKSAKYATYDGAHDFTNFEDVKKYVYGATSKADMEHRYSVLGKLYGFDSEQMQSTSMKNAFRHVEKRYLHGGSTKRGMANGQRRSALYVLTDGDIAEVSGVANKLGIPRKALSFNTGSSTSFDEALGVVNVRGDVFPDEASTNNRDGLSVAAVLAHEYYGHGSFAGTILRPGDWRDEFRASYRAAIDTPNLSEEDRANLMVDAYQRAAEAGVALKFTDEYRKLVYGY